jgi:hypothetical protein
MVEVVETVVAYHQITRANEELSQSGKDNKQSPRADVQWRPWHSQGLENRYYGRTSQCAAYQRERAAAIVYICTILDTSSVSDAMPVTKVMMAVRKSSFVDGAKASCVAVSVYMA